MRYLRGMVMVLTALTPLGCDGGGVAGPDEAGSGGTGSTPGVSPGFDMISIDVTGDVLGQVDDNSVVGGVLVDEVVTQTDGSVSETELGSFDVVPFGTPIFTFQTSWYYSEPGGPDVDIRLTAISLDVDCFFSAWVSDQGDVVDENPFRPENTSTAWSANFDCGTYSGGGGGGGGGDPSLQ